MTPIESQATAQTMLWYFLVIVSVIGVVAFLDWFAGKLLSATFDSPQEQSQREAECIAKQASREFLNRKRMDDF